MSRSRNTWDTRIDVKGRLVEGWKGSAHSYPLFYPSIPTLYTRLLSPIISGCMTFSSRWLKLYVWYNDLQIRDGRFGSILGARLPFFFFFFLFFLECRNYHEDQIHHDVIKVFGNSRKKGLKRSFFDIKMPVFENSKKSSFLWKNFLE